MLLLALLFLVIPIAELAVIVQVAGRVGVPETILALIVISVVGGWLVKREGLGVWRRLQRQLENGQLPQTEVVDGFLVLLAGALLLTPGFLTDGLAALLLLPPSRAVCRGLVLRWVRRRAVTARVLVVDRARATPFRRSDDVIDVDGDEVPPEPPPAVASLPSSGEARRS
ncbi:MAG: FxsA family protein [Acidimicrobiales bacterium]